MYTPPPAYSWTGCYVGVQAGGGVMRNFYTGRLGGGGIAGGQIGCDYQYGQLVFGAEAEAWWSGLEPKGSFTDLGDGFSEHFTTRNKWDAAISFRAGVAIDRALLYGKVGAAWGGFDFNGGNSDGNFENASATLSGLLLGAGIEYAFLAGWSAKLEYLYIAYLGQDVTFTAGGPNWNSSISTQDAWKHIVKVGLNYRFGGYGFGKAPY